MWHIAMPGAGAIHSISGARALTTTAQEHRTLEAVERGSATRIADLQVSGSRAPETMERIPPPKPRRDEDALASNSRANASRRMNSAVRWPSSGSGSPCSTASPRSAYPSPRPGDESVRGKGKPGHKSICPTVSRCDGAHHPHDKRAQAEYSGIRHLAPPQVAIYLQPAGAHSLIRPPLGGVEYGTGPL